MQFSRRAFLSLSGAAALSAAMPTLPGEAAVAEAATEAAAAAGPEYGFTFDDYIFETGFRSMDEAIRGARAYGPGRGFVTAQVDHYRLGYPSAIGENVVDHLINGKPLGYDIACWVACANEEGDFEGDFESACHRADTVDLVAVAGPAIAEALARAGRPDLSALYAAGAELPHDLPDPLLEAVSEDTVMAGVLEAAIAEWAETNALEGELRSLIVSGSVSHAPEGPGAAPALAA